MFIAKKLLTLGLAAVMSAASTGTLTAEASLSGVTAVSHQLAAVTSRSDTQVSADVTAITRPLAAIETLSAEADIPYALTSHYESREAVEPETVEKEPETSASDKISTDFYADGAGTVIAILDSDFDFSHESFRLSAPGKLTENGISGLSENLNADISGGGFYQSEKVPFMYDYAKDIKSFDGAAYSDVNIPAGTAVSSAAALNRGGHAKGTSPEAQILAMKICDGDGNIIPDAVAAAIEDAVTLGADIILISAADPCGFSDRSGYGISFDKAMAIAKSRGVPVVAGAGDVQKIGITSIFYDESRLLSPLTTDPDTGMTAYPASSDLALAVASADSNIVSAPCFLLSDGTEIPYSDSNYMYESASDYRSFKDFFGEKTLEYEFVDGVGKAEDFQKHNGTLEGKLAVIARGEIEFDAKAKNAATAGAVGIIVYDSSPDRYSSLEVRMALPTSPIPAILISDYSAELMKNSASHTLSADTDKTFELIRLNTPTPSSFSAAGAAPSLGLKPDVSVVGSNIECASSGKGYMTSSGTYIAAARFTGMTAAVKERAKTLFGAENASENAVKLLISSAQLMTQRESGIPYSPRLQGGGAASVEAAINAELLLTSDGKSKIELGETGRFLRLRVKIENLTDTDKDCKLDLFVGSNGFESFTLSELSEKDDSLAKRLGRSPDEIVSFQTDFMPFGSVSTYLGDIPIALDASKGGGYSFKLPGGVSYEFDIGVYITDETYEEYRKVFTNGFFAEGFVRVVSGDEAASIPFLGFIGSWSRADALDSDVYGENDPQLCGCGLYRIFEKGTYYGEMLLGSNPLIHNAQDAKPNADRLVFSPTTDPNNSSVYYYLKLKRNIRDVAVRIKDSSGAVICEYSHGDLPKSFISSRTGMLIDPKIFIWNGRADDNRAYIYPDGVYTAEITYRTATSGGTRSLSYKLILDGTAPMLDSYSFAANDDGTFMKISASDENGVLYVKISDTNGFEAENRGEEFDISRLTGKHLYVEILDSALNRTVERFDNPLYRVGE